LQLSWIWQAILIFFVGTLILRIGGRKSISQMTISQTIVMIGLGSLLIQPVSGKGLLVTFLVASLLTIMMIITEYFEIKIDALESIFSGKAVVVIKNGQLDINNLGKLRLSIDRLETRIRQAGISSLEDVQNATIEVNGQLGYELKENKKPITKEDLGLIMAELSNIKQTIGCNLTPATKQNPQNNIFLEINSHKFEGDKKEP
jgi:Predicted membrane protein